MWEIKQMTLDVAGGRYEIAWQPGSGGFSVIFTYVATLGGFKGALMQDPTIAIDDRDLEGNSVDWDTLDDAKAAAGTHVALCKTMNPWQAAENVWKELRKEAQAEEAANRWDANDYLGDGL